MVARQHGVTISTYQQKIAQADVVKPTEDLWRTMLADGSYPDGDSGRHAVAVLVAANLSGESGGRAVALDNGLPLERKFMWA